MYIFFLVFGPALSDYFVLVWDDCVFRSCSLISILAVFFFLGFFFDPLWARFFVFLGGTGCPLDPLSRLI